jgi:thiol peroxidase
MRWFADRSKAHGRGKSVERRVGEAFELDMKLTVEGGKLKAGDAAPNFDLESFDPGEGEMLSVTLADSAGRVRLLNVINSLDTPVCHVETRRWEGLRADLPPEAVVYTVSMDLPYAQARWQAAEEVTHQALSAHRSEAFGRDYGVLITEWRLLQRAVFVIGRDDRIVYAEYVADQMREPDYDAAVAAVRQAAVG